MCLIDPPLSDANRREVRRGGIEPPPALQLGSESLGLSADSRMRGDSATRLRSNAAPHHTLYFLIELIIISTPSIAETLSTPPIEAATDAITVTLAPKLQAAGNFVQHNIQARQKTWGQAEPSSHSRRAREKYSSRWAECSTIVLQYVISYD